MLQCPNFICIDSVSQILIFGILFNSPKLRCFGLDLIIWRPLEKNYIIRLNIYNIIKIFICLVFTHDIKFSFFTRHVELFQKP